MEYRKKLVEGAFKSLEKFQQGNPSESDLILLKKHVLLLYKFGEPILQSAAANILSKIVEKSEGSSQSRSGGGAKKMKRTKQKIIKL